MLSLKEIIQKVGPDRIRKAIEAENGNALKELIESENIFLADEQLDYVAGGIGFDHDVESLRRGNGKLVVAARSCLTEGS